MGSRGIGRTRVSVREEGNKDPFVEEEGKRRVKYKKTCHVDVA